MYLTISDINVFIFLSNTSDTDGVDFSHFGIVAVFLNFVEYIIFFFFAYC